MRKKLLILFMAFLLWSCKKEEVNTEVAIGDSYEGGVIAYILQAGDPGYDANVQHGLIAAPEDQSTGWMQWFSGGPTIVVTGATATAIGKGKTNTNTIVNSTGSGTYAAKLCDDLVLGGYNDWFLPSKDELYKLYLNKDAIGGFSNKTYWSSTESSVNDQNALVFYFADGSLNTTFKINSSYVRAIRSF